MGGEERRVVARTSGSPSSCPPSTRPARSPPRSPRSRKVGRRHHPRRRQVDRRDRRNRAQPAHQGHLAPAQRRLRRQPEDVLPGGAAGAGGRRRHVAPGRPVRADADPRPRPPHPPRRGRRRPRLAHGGAGDGESRRHAPLQESGQQVPHGGREPRHGHPADRSPHRLPRVLARRAAHGAVPAELPRLLLRLGDADAVGVLRVPHRRRAGAVGVHGGGIVDPVRAGGGVRAEDALARSPLDPSTERTSCARPGSGAEHERVGSWHSVGSAALRRHGGHSRSSRRLGGRARAGRHRCSCT